MIGALAQAELVIPEIPWLALSPELALFGAGLLALLLDTAGPRRLQASFMVFGVVAAAGAYALATGGTQLVWVSLILAGLAQFALTALWHQRPRVLGAIIAALGFVACLGLTALQWFPGAAETGIVATDTLLGGMVAVDGVALFTRVTICLAGLITIPLGYAYADARRIHRGEYYPLIMFAATGMTLLASAADFIMVFIAIEILSLALYILCGFAKRDLLAQEAAIKYFILGAFSSALLLYGIALIYGAAGTTNIAEAGAVLRSVDSPEGLLLAGLVLLIVGFGFKTALVPFHMWTPDVYQGAPTPVTGFMAAATKAAAFAAFIRIFVGAFGTLSWSWEPALWVLAVATMMAGAILAVVQFDLKRMLAYSAVAHAGYAVIGLMSTSADGVSATLLYLLVYSLMSLGAFGVLAILERQARRAMTIADVRGLGQRFPGLAGLFALFLLSLAGIPGTAGFIGKLMVFRAGVEAGHTPLVVVAILSSVIAAYFYIRVIVAMFMEEPEPASDHPDVVITLGGQTALVATAAGVIVLGVLPGVLLTFAAQAASLAG